MFIPTGGWTKPISMVLTSRMPKKIGLIPICCTMGMKMGTVRVIRARPSRNMPSASTTSTRTMVTVSLSGWSAATVSATCWPTPAAAMKVEKTMAPMMMA